ncbi:MAG: hypothetical protein H6707_21060 [Deltaproteobacteria bacterium]|nr:hypothetical protein [Deltaproteobacteria bacterium]
MLREVQRSERRAALWVGGFCLCSWLAGVVLGAIAFAEDKRLRAVCTHATAATARNLLGDRYVNPRGGGFPTGPRVYLSYVHGGRTYRAMKHVDWAMLSALRRKQTSPGAAVSLAVRINPISPLDVDIVGARYGETSLLHGLEYFALFGNLAFGAWLTGRHKKLALVGLTLNTTCGGAFIYEHFLLYPHAWWIVLLWSIASLAGMWIYIRILASKRCADD